MPRLAEPAGDRLRPVEDAFLLFNLPVDQLLQLLLDLQQLLSFRSELLLVLLYGVVLQQVDRELLQDCEEVPS